VAVKFGVGNLRFMPLKKKSHLVYSKFHLRSQRNWGGWGWVGTNPIHLASHQSQL